MHDQLDRHFKVTALLDGHISIDSTWTKDDFAALAVAAADQAGAAVRDQAQIAAILGVTPTLASAQCQAHEPWVDEFQKKCSLDAICERLGLAAQEPTGACCGTFLPCATCARCLRCGGCQGCTARSSANAD